jgi:hypothetical protein
MTVPEWKKATYSNQDSACVEVAVDVLEVGVRDTKDRDSGHLTLPASAWSAFLDRL